MDKELRDKWIIALESGNYEQCTGQLKDSKGRFCANGILLEVIKSLGTWSKLKLLIKNRIFSTMYGYITLDKLLTYNIRMQIEFQNDNSEKSFNQIANWIKENL